MGRYFDDLASPEYLAHFGTKGQKWGVRRFGVCINGGDNYVKIFCGLS